MLVVLVPLFFCCLVVVLFLLDLFFHFACPVEDFRCHVVFVIAQVVCNLQPPDLEVGRVLPVIGVGAKLLAEVHVAVLLGLLLILLLLSPLLVQLNHLPRSFIQMLPKHPDCFVLRTDVLRELVEVILRYHRCPSANAPLACKVFLQRYNLSQHCNIRNVDPPPSKYYPDELQSYSSGAQIW